MLYGLQVSPVNEHVVVEGRPWWERYQPVSYKIQTRSGNEEDFLDMSRRCNANGVRVYVDVVLNHMVGESPEPIKGTAGSKANPTKFSYPGVPFSKAHFNPPCVIENWGDRKHLRNCELNKFRDLNQSLPYVREKQVEFLNRLVDLGVAGFRVDSANHMWPLDLKHIFNAVKDLSAEFGFPPNSRALVISELVDFGSSDIDVGRWEFKKLGKVSDILPSGEFGRVFRGYTNMKHVKNWGQQWNFLPTELAVVFLVDHELQRGKGTASQDTITYREYKIYKQSSAFMLAHPHGTPRILSGYHYLDANQGPPRDEEDNIVPAYNSSQTKDGCFNGWICEHRWHPISSMVILRNEVGNTDVHGWWDNGSKQIAFSRGEKAFIAINGHEKKHFDWEIQTCLPAGTYCDVISGAVENGKCVGDSVVVDEEGYTRVSIDKDSVHGVFAIHTGAESSLRYYNCNYYMIKFPKKNIYLALPAKTNPYGGCYPGSGQRIVIRTVEAFCGFRKYTLYMVLLKNIDIFALKTEYFGL